MLKHLLGSTGQGLPHLLGSHPLICRTRTARSQARHEGQLAGSWSDGPTQRSSPGVHGGSREKWTWASSSSKKQQPRPNNKPQVNILILILLRKEANNKQTPKSTHVFSFSLFFFFFKEKRQVKQTKQQRPNATRGRV